MARIILHLGEPERSALERLAKREKRVLHAQAAFILHQVFERQGLLPAGFQTNSSNPHPGSGRSRLHQLESLSSNGAALAAPRGRAESQTRRSKNMDRNLLRGER